MLRIASTSAITAFSFLLSITAVAAEPPHKNGFYLGARTGTMSIDLEGAEDPTSSAFVIGYDFGSTALEIEHNRADFDYRHPEFGDDEPQSLSINTTGVYLAYRTSDYVYLKAKGGLLFEDIGDGKGTTEKDSGFSAGVGAGIRLGPVSLEADYTLIEADINLLNVGLHFSF